MLYAYRIQALGTKKNELVGEVFHLPMNKADNFFSFVEYQHHLS